jgi:hypothetical protein
MARGTRWWNEPPIWAWIVMVVAAVSLAVMLPIALARTAPVDGAAGSRTPSPTPAGDPAPSSTSAAPGSSSAAAASSREGPVDLVVLGDGDSAGDTAWPVLLEDGLEDVDVQVGAEAGAGYVTPGAGGQTIPELADDVDLAAAEVVVVFGSRNDGPAQVDAVARAAQELLRTVTETAPEAELLVVGPLWFSEPAPSGVRENRDAIRAAAASAEATFVDPLDEGWFVDRSDLLTTTGNPSEAGQAYLAELIEPEVRALLG